MQILSQRDLRWAGKKLGRSEFTVGRFGCTTSAISMGHSFFFPKTFLTPAQIAIQDIYTIKGLIIWDRIKLPGMRFSGRMYHRDDAAILAALKDPNRFVILQVNNGAHWVLACRPTIFGKSYRVADPWDATYCDVIARYKNITGCAFFTRA